MNKKDFNIKAVATLYAVTVCIALHFCPLTVQQGYYGVALCEVQGVYLQTAASSPPYVIAIDPGHGGMDTGAQALVEEYVVIDTTAKYLAELLEADPDFIPVFTRTDTDPSSDDRCALANSHSASLLISLHANSDSSSSSHGFECFPTPPGRPYHSESLRFALLVAAAMKDAGHTLRGGEEKTGIKYAYYSGKRNIIVDSTDEKIRSLPSFGILDKTDCPALLVEQCFVTNRQDVNSWATEEGCRRAAALYYNAIRQYFGTYSA